jgi:hypothetical protein
MTYTAFQDLALLSSSGGTKISSNGFMGMLIGITEDDGPQG